MDQLRAMRIFIRVAERGSFAAAAADLGLSHGMASAVVKDLEAALGVELIRRTTRRMALTETGLDYLEAARDIVGAAETLAERMRLGRDTVAGTVSVQAPTALSRLVIAPSLGDLLERHPDLRLRLHARDGFPDVIAEGLDLVIYVGEMPDSSLVLRRLGRFPLVTVASPAYLARHGRPETIADLARHRLIDILSVTTGRPLEWQFSIDGRSVRRPTENTILFDSSEASIAAALNGAGVLHMISYAVSDAIADGRLVQLLQPWLDPGPEMSLVTRRQIAPPARLRVVIQHFEALVRARRARDREILGA